MIIHLWNLARGPGRKKEHCGCSVHSSFVYYKPYILPWQPFQSKDVPTATVTAFYRKEGHRHSCELLLLQTEKHLNWRLQFSTEWVCWNTALQGTAITHTAQKCGTEYTETTLPFFAVLPTSFLHSSNFALNFCASVSVKIKYFFVTFTTSQHWILLILKKEIPGEALCKQNL